MKKYLLIVLFVGVGYSKNIDHNYDLDLENIFRESRLIESMTRNKSIKLESFNVKLDTIVYNFGKPAKKRQGSITRKVSTEGDELSSSKFYYSKYSKSSTILKSNRKVRYKYDKSGNIIEKEWISDDDKNNAITILEYDTKNRLINETSYDRYGKISINTTLDYKEANSRVNKKTEIGNFSFEDIDMYDKDEKLYATVISVNGMAVNVMEYKYDKNNNIVKIVHKKNTNDDSIRKEEEFLWEDGFITKISISMIGSELDNLPKKDKLYLVKEYNISKYKYYDISNGDYDKGNRSGTWVKYLGAKKQIEYTYQNKSPNMWHRNYDYVKFQKGKVIKKGQYRKGRLDGSFEEYDKKTYALISAGSYLNGKKENDWKYYYSNSQLKKEGSYSKGKENGSWTYYDSNSSAIDSVGNYLNGEKDNVWKYYSTNSSGESVIEREVIYSNYQIKSKKIFTDDSFYEIVYDKPGSRNYKKYDELQVKVESYDSNKGLRQFYHSNGIISETKDWYLNKKFNEQGELLSIKYTGGEDWFFEVFPLLYDDHQHLFQWKTENSPKENYTIYAKGDTRGRYMVGEWSFYYRSGIEWVDHDDEYRAININIQEGKDVFIGKTSRLIKKMPLYTKISYNQGDGSKRSEFDIPLSGIKEDQQIVTYYYNGQIKQKFMLWIDSDSLKYHDKYEEWYENGQLKKRLKYEKGHLVGLAELWHENGNKAVEGNFKYPGIFNEKNSYKSWYENGVKRRNINIQTRFTKTIYGGLRAGLYAIKETDFDENGDMIKTKKYKKIKTGTITYNDQGRAIGEAITVKKMLKAKDGKQKVSDAMDKIKSTLYPLRFFP